MRIPSKIEIDTATGEVTEHGSKELTEEQKQAAIEFLFHVCESINSKTA